MRAGEKGEGHGHMVMWLEDQQAHRAPANLLFGG